ncbi:hypothetical protein QL285_051485 [Trifolium repens]|nr:hypothetical protein QL285_051485 [Trifolium repens]
MSNPSEEEEKFCKCLSFSSFVSIQRTPNPFGNPLNPSQKTHYKFFFLCKRLFSLQTLLSLRPKILRILHRELLESFTGKPVESYCKPRNPLSLGTLTSYCVLFSCWRRTSSRNQEGLLELLTCNSGYGEVYGLVHLLNLEINKAFDSVGIGLFQQIDTFTIQEL